MTSNHNRIDVSGAYWFLLYLFSCKVLFWCVLKLPKMWIQVIPIIGLTFAELFEVARLPLCLDSDMSMIGIMYVGYILKKIKDEKWVQRAKAISWWYWLFICISGGTTIIINAGINIRCNHYANIWLLLIGCLLTLFGYLGLARWLDKIQNRVIQCIINVLKYMGVIQLCF